MRKRKHYKNSAEECRERGFDVGDKLRCYEVGLPIVVELCEIGDKRIKVIPISFADVPVDARWDKPTRWSLEFEDWEKVEP